MKIESTGRLLKGLATGTVFGWLLQKGRASRPQAITEQLRGTGHEVLKLMTSASAVGAVGTWLLSRRGVVEPSPKPLKMGGVVLGGVVFGAGMGLLGYCPGTSVAGIGEGHLKAAAGVAGMFAGALAFVALYPRLKPLLDAGDYGELTLPEVTHTPTGAWAAGLASAVGLGAALSR